MAILNLLDVNLSFGGPSVLENVNLQIDPGERVCLVGRNGTGKSTLMRVIVGKCSRTGDRFSALPGRSTPGSPRKCRPTWEARSHDVVSSGVRPEGDHHEEDWEREVRIENLIERLQLDPNAPFATLSGGLKRRALLGRALASKPDLLLLDEPTNHLDVTSILWLEEFLLEAKITLLFVTHDRAFLRRLATRIIELDRGRLASWSCNYETYLVRKQEVLEAEEKERAQFDKKLAQEEVWIRRGVRAQRSRAQSRINQLMQMRAERRARRDKVGNVTMRLSEEEKTGFKVIEADKLTFAWNGGRAAGARLFDGHHPRGQDRPDRPQRRRQDHPDQADAGPIRPHGGIIKNGTNLEVIYFDQHRAQIDDNRPWPTISPTETRR